MPSVIPSVMLSVSVVLVMLLILSGIVQYYTIIVNEPPLLPTYGSLYVRDVSVANGTVTIANRYGYPVKALLSIALNTDAIRRDHNVTPPAIISSWIVIEPGETNINIYRKLEELFGSVKPEYVVWDESGFLVANVFFPLVRGAGALLPGGGPQGGGSESEYTLTGIGTSRLNPRYVFATKYFDGTTLSTRMHHYAAFGYMRSICDYREPTVITTYRYGTRCRYDWSELYGCAYWYCSQWVNGTCTRWDCCNCNSSPYRSDGTADPTHDYNQFPCGLDQGVCFYRTPFLVSSVYQTIMSPSLLGLMNDPTGLVNESKTYTFTYTSASTVWEYILPSNEQNRCVYTYREIEYWTSFSTSRHCCGTCEGGSVCATAYYCTEYSATRYTENRHACQYALGGSWWCADRRVFLTSELLSGNAVVWVRQSDDKLVLQLNITVEYRFTRYYDPEFSDTVVRLVPIYLLEVTLPPLKGYVSIPYHEDLRSVEAFVTARVTGFTAVLRTGTGYVDQFPLISATAIGWSDAAPSVSPVGYIAVSPREGFESAKTFSVSTPPPTIYVKVFREQDPYVTVPLCNLPCQQFGCACSNTVRLSAVVTVEVTPGFTIRTVRV